MQNILFDDPRDWKNLLPLTYTRSVSDIRVGITTIREKWQHFVGKSPGVFTARYLQPKYPLDRGYSQSLYFNGSVIPNSDLINAIFNLSYNQKLVQRNTVIAAYAEHYDAKNPEELDDFFKKLMPVEYKNEFLKINHPWDIFKLNGDCIKSDFELVGRGRPTQQLSDTNLIIGQHRVYVEPGVVAEACVFNTTAGPIYLGKNSEVMEGTLIRGPFVLGEGAVLKMGAKIYGPTTIGPHCKVGGEVNNSVFFGYSNKAHDGFIGNSVIGEWCNIGADSNNSNLKNNYGNVKVYNFGSETEMDTGLQFCGLIMGDHAKCGINTMFNTGTVVGVGANVFDGGFPPKMVKSFAWGGKQGFEKYELDK
ncbi:MAG TPA: putative sugar nucleotidyl transferase, partial [Flavobacteriales bacterium]|nr:putative sugar nucleotidyl transferase [Flavobacteriales bacterium]